MDDLTFLWAALANIFIALSYIGIAFLVIPNVRFGDGGHPGSWLAIGCGVGFFILCGGHTHLHEAFHAWNDRVYYFSEWHYLISHTVQAVLGWGVFIFSSLFLRITIGSKEDAPSRAGH